ncbi:MAG: metal-dependent transcriptional regulator [Erysipelothrix sp.]|nr:metal-dependent transcriptional regulator [Erysipelothrix sp.]
MHVDESREMYLKTILLLTQESDFVRSVDVANKLNYSKPSVSRAVKNLVLDGSIEVLDDGNIVLLPEGLKEAEEVKEKHQIIKNVFIKYLNLDEEIADKDACRIEHVISEETFAALKKL